MDAKSVWLIIVQIIFISLNSYCIGLSIYENEKMFWNYVAIVLLYASIFARLIWKVQ